MSDDFWPWGGAHTEVASVANMRDYFDDLMGDYFDDLMGDYMTAYMLPK